jgi:hypothetical protein
MRCKTTRSWIERPVSVGNRTESCTRDTGLWQDFWDNLRDGQVTRRSGDSCSGGVVIFRSRLHGMSEGSETSCDSALAGVSFARSGVYFRTGLIVAYLCCAQTDQGARLILPITPNRPSQKAGQRGIWARASRTDSWQELRKASVTYRFLGCPACVGSGSADQMCVS